eukprot:1030791-Pleurochrysis_carterae.AAC.1
MPLCMCNGVRRAVQRGRACGGVCMCNGVKGREAREGVRRRVYVQWSEGQCSEGGRAAACARVHALIPSRA